MTRLLVVGENARVEAAGGSGTEVRVGAGTFDGPVYVTVVLGLVNVTSIPPNLEAASYVLKLELRPVGVVPLGPIGISIARFGGAAVAQAQRFVYSVRSLLQSGDDDREPRIFYWDDRLGGRWVQHPASSFAPQTGLTSADLGVELMRSDGFAFQFVNLRPVEGHTWTGLLPVTTTPAPPGDTTPPPAGPGLLDRLLDPSDLLPAVAGGGGGGILVIGILLACLCCRGRGRRLGGEMGADARLERVEGGGDTVSHFGHVREGDFGGLDSLFAGAMSRGGVLRRVGGRG